MRIVYITAGAAGMYCGSCMKDNTLVAALNRLGCEALLIPTYTPIRTDEEDVSQRHVFFGGINVYLQQKSWLFRHTPWFVDRLLNFPGLLRWVSRYAHRTKYEDLGDLTISMLQGRSGNQRKELQKLVEYLRDDIKPQAILLTNVLLSGVVPELKKNLGVPILPVLQGDDIFLEALLPKHRTRAIELIGENCRMADGFFATSRFYADMMSGYLNLPREKIHVVYPGLNLQGFGLPKQNAAGATPRVGYFARICPEKGFHQLADAFRLLRTADQSIDAHLCVSGWLGENQRAYFAEHLKRLDEAGLSGAVHHLDSPNHDEKIRFLEQLDVFSVPTIYREPKGLYVLEAMACGVPVVQPRHGSFPELIEMTGGGILVEPENPVALAEGIARLLKDPVLRKELGEHGKEAVFRRFTAERMARDTLDVLHEFTR